jgi:hypothetical protein
MKHRTRSASNDEGPSDDLLGRWESPWEAVARFALGAAVIVSVTLCTGSVEEGVIAVSAVAAAARIGPRRRGLA